MALVGGAGAAPEGSASSAKPPGASGDTARPNYMGPSGNGLVGADERGRNPAESRAYRMGAPVRFQKAVSRSKENAAVKRRKASRPASRGRLFPSAEGTGPTARRPPGAAIRTSAGRRFAPSVLGGHSPKAAGRPFPRNDGAWLDET